MAALLSGFGATLCLAAILPEQRRRERQVAAVSLAAAAAGAVLWASLETVQIGGSMASVGVVLGDTLFGHLVLARLGLLAVALAALWRRAMRVAAVAAGLAVASQALHGHALAMDQGWSWLLLSEVLHVVAAGAWLGGLAPLALFVAAAPVASARRAAQRFGVLGAVCVAVLAATALEQSWVLVGGLAGLLGTAYGLVALAKLALFVLLLGMAARNRWRLTPALEAPGGRALLGRSIAWETVAGLAVVLAAGLLTSIEPSMHQQPAWPFAWQLSLEAVAAEPEFLHEVLIAGAAMVAASVLACVALVRRWRGRIAWAAVAPAVFWVAAPHLDLLLAPAHPTQFWSSPTGFAGRTIARGAALYPEHCALCHGPRGAGDGPAAASLPVPPADLTAAHLWAHPDGELFWWLAHGIEGPDGQAAMPGFADRLSEDDRWALIDYIRANNAGQARRDAGAWPFPVQAPAVDLSCPTPEWTTLADLRGRVVRLVFGPAQTMDGVVTVAVGGPPGPDLCMAQDGAATEAYAVATGMPAAALAGSQVLIDARGWLRALLPAGNAADLAGMVRQIEAQPLAANPPGHEGMKM